MATDGAMAAELREEVINRGGGWPNQAKSIVSNLARKKAKGTYDAEKAVKLWRYAVDEAAKRQAKEFGFNSRDISGDTRNEAARDLRDYFDAQVEAERVHVSESRRAREHTRRRPSRLGSLERDLEVHAASQERALEEALEENRKDRERLRIGFSGRA